MIRDRPQESLPSRPVLGRSKLDSVKKYFETIAVLGEPVGLFQIGLSSRSGEKHVLKFCRPHSSLCGRENEGALRQYYGGTISAQPGRPCALGKVGDVRTCLHWQIRKMGTEWERNVPFFETRFYNLIPASYLQILRYKVVPFSNCSWQKFDLEGQLRGPNYFAVESPSSFFIAPINIPSTSGATLEDLGCVSYPPSSYATAVPIYHGA